jgi:hypothetical protein
VLQHVFDQKAFAAVLFAAQAALEQSGDVHLALVFVEAPHGFEFGGAPPDVARHGTQTAVALVALHVRSEVVGRREHAIAFVLQALDAAGGVGLVARDVRPHVVAVHGDDAAVVAPEAGLVVHRLQVQHHVDLELGRERAARNVAPERLLFQMPLLVRLQFVQRSEPLIAFIASEFFYFSWARRRRLLLRMRGHVLRQLEARRERFVALGAQVQRLALIMAGHVPLQLGGVREHASALTEHAIQVAPLHHRVSAAVERQQRLVGHTFATVFTLVPLLFPLQHVLLVVRFQLAERARLVAPLQQTLQNAVRRRFVARQVLLDARLVFEQLAAQLALEPVGVVRAQLVVLQLFERLVAEVAAGGVARESFDVAELQTNELQRFALRGLRRRFESEYLLVGEPLEPHSQLPVRVNARAQVPPHLGLARQRPVARIANVFHSDEWRPETSNSHQHLAFSQGESNLLVEFVQFSSNVRFTCLDFVSALSY